MQYIEQYKCGNIYVPFAMILGKGNDLFPSVEKKTEKEEITLPKLSPRHMKIRKLNVDWLKEDVRK